MLRVEYKKVDSCRILSPPLLVPLFAGSAGADMTTAASSSLSPQMIACELRCNLDTGGGAGHHADPPPQTVMCLRQHRLSAGGRGLWLSLMHDTMLATNERLQIPRVAGQGRLHSSRPADCRI
ncbi:hypothetical protein CONPUDRAFT_139105, partial [Coniophora puteana RWD-64-598 SS2]